MSGYDIKIHANMLAMPPFEKIWLHYENKDHAIRFLKYVIFNNHPLSHYVKSYGEKDRVAMLQKELFDGTSIEIDTELMKSTEEAFIALHTSLMQKLLAKLRKLAEDFIDDIDAGRIGLEKAVALGPKTEALVRSIISLEGEVKSEIKGKSSIKGGYKLGILEKRLGYEN